MQFTLIISGKNLDKGDIRNFIKKIREWELRTSKGEIQSIKMQTDPPLSSNEKESIFAGVFKECEDSGEFIPADEGLLRLGRRAVRINGTPIGIVQELTLQIGASTDESNKQLQEADIIELVKVNDMRPDLASQMLKTLKEQ